MVVDSPTVEKEDGECSSSEDGECNSSHVQREVTTNMQGLSIAATLDPKLRAEAFAMIEKQVLEQKNKAYVLRQLGLSWAWVTRTNGVRDLKNQDLYSRQLHRFYSQFNQ